MKIVFTGIKKRLLQESTWRGILLLLGLAGIQLAPGEQETIIAAVAGIIASINILKND